MGERANSYSGNVAIVLSFFCDETEEVITGELRQVYAVGDEGELVYLSVSRPVSEITPGQRFDNVTSPNDARKYGMTEHKFDDDLRNVIVINSTVRS